MSHMFSIAQPGLIISRTSPSELILSPKPFLPKPGSMPRRDTTHKKRGRVTRAFCLPSRISSDRMKAPRDVRPSGAWPSQCERLGKLIITCFARAVRKTRAARFALGVCNGIRVKSKRFYKWHI